MHVLISGNTNEIPQRYLVWPSFLTGCPCFNIVPPGEFSDSTPKPTSIAIHHSSPSQIIFKVNTVLSMRKMHSSQQSHTSQKSKGVYLINWAIKTHFTGRIPKQICSSRRSKCEELVCSLKSRWNMCPHSTILNTVYRCGRLAYQVISPWSLLTYPYVKAAILSTYNDDPCGPCTVTLTVSKIL